MNKISDYWQTEDFEHSLTAAIISMYEDKILKNKYVVWENRLKEKHLRLYRSKGCYMPSNSRIVISPESYKNPVFDTKNDILPKSFSVGFNGRDLNNEKHCYSDCYFFAVFGKKVDSLPRGWSLPEQRGTLYSAYFSASFNGGIMGDRFFFVVSKYGGIHSCNNFIHDEYGRKHYEESHVLRDKVFWASFALQFWVDKRFCWSITAIDSGATVELGCMKEEVKSLLYAREAPLSELGRKRPILHLVDSHKRRMRNGVDVDISGFLRGSQIVDMYGARFIVNPPKNIQSDLSEKSGRYYSTSRSA